MDSIASNELGAACTGSGREGWREELRELLKAMEQEGRDLPTEDEIGKIARILPQEEWRQLMVVVITSLDYRPRE